MSGGKDKVGRCLAPLLFVALVACLLGAFLGAADDEPLITIPAAAAAALVAAAICLAVLRVDARLAAAETAAAVAEFGVGESVHSFARSGRSALLVSIRLDRGGRVLEAAAIDPDDYS